MHYLSLRKKERKPFQYMRVKMVKVNGKLHRRTIIMKIGRTRDICGVFPRDIHRLDCDMAECPVRGNQFTACEYDYEAYY